MSNTTMENTGDALGQSIKLTEQARTDFSNQISALNGKISNIGTSWTGQGSVAFSRVIQAWNDEVQRLLTALEEFGQNLQGTEQTFNVTDQDVTDALSQLTNRLG